MRGIAWEESFTEGEWSKPLALAAVPGACYPSAALARRHVRRLAR